MIFTVNLVTGLSFKVQPLSLECRLAAFAFFNKASSYTEDLLKLEGVPV